LRLILPKSDNFIENLQQSICTNADCNAIYIFKIGYQNENISVLGCGWLGFPLAEALLEKAFV
jgi:hypothetical protein